jgi:hypothetical protein
MARQVRVSTYEWEKEGLKYQYKDCLRHLLLSDHPERRREHHECFH